MRQNGFRFVWRFMVCCAVVFTAFAAERPVHSSPLFNEFVYVAASNGTIKQFGVRPDGTIAPLPVPVVRLASNTQAVTLVLHPTLPFANATTVYGPMGKTFITTYRIQPNGSLAPIKSLPMRVEGIIRQLVTDGKGRFLFAIRSGQVLAFRFQSDGTLSRAPSSSIDGNMDSYNEEINGGAGPAHAGSLLFDPLCRFAYNYEGYAFGDHSESTLTTYKILSSGRLRKTKGEQNLDEIGFDTAGRWAYVTSFDSSVTLLSIQPNGNFAKSVPQQFKEPFDAKVRLLNTRTRTIILEGGYKLIFANASPAGQLKNFATLDVPHQQTVISLESINSHFAIAALQQSQKISSLVMINTGDATHKPKIIQSLPLGAETIQAVVSRSARF